MKHSTLPRTAKDALTLRPIESLLFNGLSGLFKLLGVWRYPAGANGDLEGMTFLDKAYWIYKTENPVRRARRHSGLEEFFERQKNFVPEEIAGFESRAELTLSSAGDLMPHEFLPRTGRDLYRDVADVLFGADIPMANLECVIRPRASGKVTFSSKSGPSLFYTPEDFELASGFQGRKFRFLAAACNHSLDFGAEGVASTIRALRDSGISFSGVNEQDADAFEATVIEENGIRVGLVAHTFGLNARKPPPGRQWIVNRTHLNRTPEDVDFGLFEKQIRYCRDRAVDFIVAHLHWGLEHELYPTPEQIDVAHFLAEMGIDAIVGHHPHVVQPLEHYRTKRDANRVVPIYYSLGNLINPFTAPWLCASHVARLTLEKGVLPDGSTRTYVKNADYVELCQIADEKTGTLRLVRT